jgi:hypothetical protein
MNPRIHMAWLVLALAPAFALAEGKSYMTLVGELMGATESPQMIRDYCAKRTPGTSAEYSRLYEGWATRHKDLLGAVGEQLARANVRLKKQGAPGGDRPIDFMRQMATQKLEQALGGMTSVDVVQYCSGYSQLIDKKDNEAETSIRQLLSVVEYADQKLTERERT